MLATTGPLPSGPGWSYEFKWDGVRAIATVAGGRLRLHARSGAEITIAYPELAGLATAVGAAEVDRLRSAAMDAAGRRLSTNDVLCAHLVTTIRALDGDPSSRSLAVTVDIRSRLGLSLATVGNLLDEVQVWSTPDCPVPALAGDIRAAVEDFARSHLRHRANLAFVSELGWARLAECVPVFFDPPRRAFTVSNWSGFGAYEVAFEGQRPVVVSPAAATTLPWTATVIEGFDGAGYLCAVTLPARLAAKLRTPDGTAALHRHRGPDDTLPPLATQVRKLL
jgi:Transferase family